MAVYCRGCNPSDVARIGGRGYVKVAATLAGGRHTPRIFPGKGSSYDDSPVGAALALYSARFFHPIALNYRNGPGTRLSPDAERQPGRRLSRCEGGRSVSLAGRRQVGGDREVGGGGEQGHVRISRQDCVPRAGEGTAGAVV